MQRHSPDGMATEWEAAFGQYLEGERRASGYTVRNYLTDVRQFGEYLTATVGHLAWDGVDADLVRGWMAQLMDDGIKAATVNAKLSSVRAFYRFLLLTGRVDRDPSRLVQGPRKDKLLPAFVREGEMNRLLELMDRDREGLDPVRDRLVVLTLYMAGLRLSELVGLNIEDIDMASCQLRVTGKRNKQRVVPFGAEMREAIQRYMAERGRVENADTRAFFINSKGARISAWHVETLVRDSLGMVTTATRRSPHVLRHTFATMMLNGGAGLETVKELLGHESAATTQIYTHTTFEHLRQVYRDCHPRS